MHQKAPGDGHSQAHPSESRASPSSHRLKPQHHSSLLQADDDDDDEDADDQEKGRKRGAKGGDAGHVPKNSNEVIAGHAKMKKRRRSRASVKPPLHVFPADASNFMAMVHQLTGIPSFPSTRGFHVPSSGPSKSFPFMQGLPTLDTSSPMLSRWSHNYVSNLQGAHNLSRLDASSSQKQPGFVKSAYVDNNPNAESAYTPSIDNGSCALPPSMWEASEDYYAIGREYTHKEPLPHHIKDEVSLVGTTGLESLVSDHSPIIDSWQCGNGVLSSKKEFN